MLDVRSAVEMALDPVRLPGAARIATGDLELRLREVPRDVTVVLYGERSERTRGDRAFAYGCLAERLRAAGFRTVRALVGGLHAWRRRGYPLESAVGGGGWPGAPDPTRADDEEIAPGGHPLSLPS